MGLDDIVTSSMGPTLCMLILTVSWTCNSFNLDTTRPTIYLGNQSENFGYRVLSHQHPAGSSWVIISAPTTKEDGYGELGRIYKCLMTTEITGSCEVLPVPEKSLNLHLGLSLRSNNEHPAVIMACGPTGEISCKDNTFLRTSCFTYNGRLEHVDTLHLGSVEGCGPKAVDVVVLLDGSSSVHADDFTRGKNFISDLVADARTRNAQVAVAQYATRFKKEFDFHNFSQSSDPTRLVSRIQHMLGGTLTAGAMLDVLKMMFLPEVGARKQAKKVMLVITDGETYDERFFKNVIEESEKKDVIRFAVGVGKASEGAGKLQLEIIASKPIENHLFFVTDYMALAGILHKLQENIFIIEGESSNVTSFITELAEPGLGLHISKDVTLFGAPGMYDWTGAVLQQANGKLVTSIRDVKMKNRKATYQEASDSYIGYALSSLHLRSRRLIAAGAPRFRHTGKVMLMSLQADTGTMMLEQELLGFQLGSSFGSEMCSLDINNDGYTDMLLVSAPLYCVRGDEGRVYIYTVQEDDSADKVKLQLKQELTGKEGDSTGRFGSSLATMGDMNGDGHVDVAVGAPLEEDNGVVYMFLGTDHGLQNHAAQRLMAADFSPSLRLFGWSLAAGLDLTGDKIPELVVGALGGVTVFRGRPVLEVDTAVMSLPSEIPLWPLRCKAHKRKAPLAMSKSTSRTTDMESMLQPLPLNFTVCFSARAMNTKPDRGSRTVELRYDLLLDGEKSTPRATFGLTNHLQQSIILQVTNNQFCRAQKIHVSCDDNDVVTPIHVALNFSLQNSLAGHWMLEPNLNTHRHEKILFEKDCGIDGICTPNMTLSVSLASGELVVGRDHSLRVAVQLRNFGEDAYYTELRLSFPPILLYSSVQKSVGDVYCRLQVKGMTEHSTLFCAINPPIFKTSAKSSFMLNFEVMQVTSNDTSLSLQAFAVSERYKTAVTRVQDRIYQAANILVYGETTKYLSADKTDKGNMSLVYIFKVENIGASVQQLKLHIAAPVSTDKHEFAEYSNLTINSTATCLETMQRKPKKEERKDIWDCSHATCVVWDCTIRTMEKGDILTLSLHGHVILPTLTKISGNMVTITVPIFVRLDENIYRQVPAQGTVHHQAKVDKVLEVRSYLNLTLIITVSLFGGILLVLLIVAVLYKVGFFKRHYTNFQNNKVEGAGGDAGDSSGDGSGDGSGEGAGGDAGKDAAGSETL